MAEKIKASFPTKPALHFWNIWNISFGFLGVQIGYSLQNANTSRILSAIGADPTNLSYFWLAAPLAGLIVQPIVGIYSDRIWTRLGRRIPFILGGALISALAMFFMPNSEHFARLLPALFFGAVMLLFMDTSFNVTMQPFRALVSDMVPDSQRNIGYSVQSFLINMGAVIGSMLPFFLTYIGLDNTPKPGARVPDTVIWSFYLGGAVLLLTVLWTSFRTKEYPPELYKAYNQIDETKKKVKKPTFVELIRKMPAIIPQLGVTQFFSWFSLFLMWVYTTQGIAEHIWQSKDPSSIAYNAAANWTGVIFAAYSIFAALFSLILTPMANKFGRKNTYMFSLLLGGIGLISMVFITNKYLLLLSMVGVGCSWAGILAMPYALLSSALPAEETGVYMGIFNATITVPQIAAGLLGGFIFKLSGHNAIVVIGLSGLSMLLAGFSSKIFIRSGIDK